MSHLASGDSRRLNQVQLEHWDRNEPCTCLCEICMHVSNQTEALVQAGTQLSLSTAMHVNSLM